MAGATRNLPFPLPVRAARCAAVRIAGACPHLAEVGAAAKDEVRLFSPVNTGKKQVPAGSPSGADAALPCAVEVGYRLLLQGICRQACSGRKGNSPPQPARLHVFGSWTTPDVLYLFYHARASRGGTKKCLPPAWDRLRRVAPARRF